MDEIKLPEPAFMVTKSGRLFTHPEGVDCTGKETDVYTADQLRAAVEADRARRQPGQPVAFVKPHGATVKLKWASVDAAHNAIPGPLYAEQPARKPLTTEQVCAEMARLEPEHDTFVMSFLAGVRFAEIMHGIGE